MKDQPVIVFVGAILASIIFLPPDRTSCLPALFIRTPAPIILAGTVQKLLGARGNRQGLQLLFFVMNEIATITVFLLAIAALIASFTAVERRAISAVRASKTLVAETLPFKKSEK